MGLGWTRRLLFVSAVVALAVAVLARTTSVSAQQVAPAARPQAASAAPSSHAAVLNQYCVTCHNARLKTGGLVLDPSTLGNVGASADTWEKVVRKLRANAMPPLGAPRPPQPAYDSVTAFLETELDKAGAARPQLGKLPLAHRLSRTEYQNAVRDLLGLGALPKEMSVDYLLPADNISSGFDNIADLLFISPTSMERYLDAARKISRLAVGDPTMPVMVNIHRLDPEHPQDERVDELPFGTRGGLAVQSDFPVDGNYVFKIDLAGVGRDPHQIEVMVDGARVKLETVGGAPAEGARRRAAPEALELSIPITAGPRLVGVSFVQHTEARDESTLRPRPRSRGTQPAIASVTISGPYDGKVPAESPSRRRVFVCRPTGPADEPACARRILSELAHRAYRRPVTSQDLQDLMPFYTEGRTEGGFDIGIQRAIERMLVSSQFLFRIERQPTNVAAGAAYRVSDLDLASRLSFFLWSSIPDDELLRLAESGQLRDPLVIERQVRRMLADPKSESMVTNFAAQWLFLRDIQAKLPDEILFADFDETLRQAMRRETELFVASVFRENRSVLDLLTANYTFLNERLARHYGVPNVKGSYFRRVTLPEGSPRGGLLGQGSILTITSYATRTSPVLRGKWVLENLLSAAPPPPPANIPALKTEGAEPDKPLSMREAMARHRANPACATCHVRMDPIGFAMENFDGIGRWRDAESGQAIDASGAFPGGSSFVGVQGVKRELLKQPELFVHTVAERLLMYAVGRNLQYYDAPSVRTIVRESAASQHTLASLVVGVVKSRPFQMREATE